MTEPQPFRVELSRQARRVVEGLSAADRARVTEALDALEHEPRPQGKQVKAIQGTRDAFLRYSVGDYRLPYENVDHVVLVAGIVARKDLEGWIRRHRG
jgi:mRNA-degrading endonuclease RelE of RelBE toxin-antitoxin system